MQETYLRAWRSLAGFEGRASIRSWLYKIATNVCLSALEPRKIRMLPSGLAGPADGTDRPPTQVAPGEISWLEPWPDRWITTDADDPAAIVVARESLRLAMIASLQHLPARQRAIFLLREVLSFSAAETADILDTTTAAVKSGLQRARARLDELEPEPEDLLEPTDQRARALLEGYIAAFERSDAALLEHVLRAGRHARGDTIPRMAGWADPLHPPTRSLCDGRARRLADDRHNSQWATRGRRLSPGQRRLHARARHGCPSRNGDRRLARDRVPQSGTGHHVRLLRIACRLSASCRISPGQRRGSRAMDSTETARCGLRVMPGVWSRGA